MRVTVINMNNERVIELDYTITSLNNIEDGVYEYTTNVKDHVLYSKCKLEIGAELELTPFEKIDNVMIAEVI